VCSLAFSVQSWIHSATTILRSWLRPLLLTKKFEASAASRRTQRSSKIHYSTVSGRTGQGWQPAGVSHLLRVEHSLLKRDRIL